MVEQVRLNMRKVFIGGALYVVLVIGITAFLFYKIFIEQQRFLAKDQRDPWGSNTWLALILFVLVDLLCIIFIFLQGRAGLLWKIKATAIYPGGFGEVREAVQDISTASGISPPELAVIEDDRCNALSLHAGDAGMIVFTQGLVKALNREELRAVVAHEMAHLFNRDSYLNTFIAYIRGFLRFHADRLTEADKLEQQARSTHSTRGMARAAREMARALILSWPVWMFLFSMLGIVLATMITEDSPPKIVVGTLWLLMINIAILIIFGMLTQWAINPTRELLADALALKWTMHPEAMASALRKIEDNCTLPGLAFLGGALFAPLKTSMPWTHKLQPSVDASIRNMEEHFHMDMGSAL